MPAWDLYVKTRLLNAMKNPGRALVAASPDWSVHARCRRRISPVDAKNKVIVEQAVTNQAVDMGLLTQTEEPAREILDVETIDVVADRGYFKAEDIEACEKGRLHSARSQTATRLLGPRGLL